VGKWLKSGGSCLEFETTFNVEIAQAVIVKGHPEDRDARAYLSLSTSGRMTTGEMRLVKAELRSVDREAAATNR